MANNLENKEVLSDEILNAIDLIIKHTPNAVFGGSIALNAVGLINRKVSDIDLFFHLNESLTQNGFLSIENDGEILSDTVTIKSQRKPTCFNRGMNLVNNFTNIFGGLK